MAKYIERDAHGLVIEGFDEMSSITTTMMDQIWGTLYLGSMDDALNVAALTMHNIKTILTIMNYPISDDQRQPNITYHWINAQDVGNWDLLTYFPEANDIIDGAVTAGNNAGILVHCAAGVSRSATIVIAYLMQTLQRPYEEVRDLVRRRRPEIYPNEGFVDQLELFEAMDYCLDANDRRLRHYLLNTYVRAVEDGLDQYFQRLSVAEKLTLDMYYGVPYACISCAAVLFNEINVVKNYQYNGPDVCGRVFIEPQPWMSDQLAAPFDETVHELEVKCPHCRQVVAKCATMISNYKLLVKNIDCKCGHHNGVRGLKIMMLGIILDNKSMSS
ncbi:unnamed protein product [Medioppia subpectinata]|uniref:protein-tyrosine-phosphatase n=1 Tax=Medioppia subpectinata TaxID=1979941 RepID=A0A7R9KBQ7_9ACAR|nr:unnamed protein product [Medioppia subpectinata]CAG2100484.1 unnamed protein product [Medioppia subpectinata]